MNTITNPSSYIKFVVLFFLMVVVGSVGIFYFQNNNLIFAYSSGLALIGLFGIIISLIFMRGSNLVLSDQKRQYEKSKIYWRNTNKKRYDNSDNVNNRNNGSASKNYYENWEDSRNNNQLLENIHDLYGIPDLDSRCTDNFSGKIAYDVEVDNFEGKYYQEYWNGQMTNEYVTDKDGYSLK